MGRHGARLKCFSFPSFLDIVITTTCTISIIYYSPVFVPYRSAMLYLYTKTPYSLEFMIDEHPFVIVRFSPLPTAYRYLSSPAYYGTSMQSQGLILTLVPGRSSTSPYLLTANFFDFFFVLRLNLFLGHGNFFKRPKKPFSSQLETKNHRITYTTPFVSIESKPRPTHSTPTLHINSQPIPRHTHQHKDPPLTTSHTPTMSDPLTIPKRPPHQPRSQPIPTTNTSTPSASTPSPSPSSLPYHCYTNRLSPASIDSCLNVTPSYSSSAASSPLHHTASYGSGILGKDKGKGPARASMSSSMGGEGVMGGRRCSLLGEGFSRSEHTVVNVGGEECLRLVRSSSLSQQR